MKDYEKVYYAGEMRTAQEMKTVYKQLKTRMDKFPDVFTSLKHKAENAEMLNRLERIAK